jgi:predicted transcriptional regulator
MFARDIMHRLVPVVRSGDDLERTTEIMEASRCGVVVVVDESGSPVGVITEEILTKALEEEEAHMAA